MAKKTTKKKMQPAATAVAAGPQCSLRRIPDSPNFEAATDATLTLFTHDHIGMVLIAKAEYGGKQLVLDGTATSKITFPVLHDRNTLKLVFVFSASITGQGELREDCGGGESQFLRALNGDEPLQLVRIIGR
jgi:hypothetical protein